MVSTMWSKFVKFCAPFRFAFLPEFTGDSEAPHRHWNWHRTEFGEKRAFRTITADWIESSIKVKLVSLERQMSRNRGSVCRGLSRMEMDSVVLEKECDCELFEGWPVKPICEQMDVPSFSSPWSGCSIADSVWIPATSHSMDLRASCFAAGSATRGLSRDRSLLRHHEPTRSLRRHTPGYRMSGALEGSRGSWSAIQALRPR